MLQPQHLLSYTHAQQLLTGTRQLNADAFFRTLAASVLLAMLQQLLLGATLHGQTLSC
jgi:hypothetical protein